MCKDVPPMSKEDFTNYSNMPRIPTLFLILLSNGKFNILSGDISDFHNANPQKVSDNNIEQKQT
jgi:hypothetical protein